MTTNKTAFKTKEITATARMSIERKGNWFTFECSETRTVNYDALPKNLDEAEKAIEDEYLALWDTVNGQLDNQIIELDNYLKQTK